MEKIIKSEARLDSNAYENFNKQVDESLTADCNVLIIDMADTQYISSVCLRVLQKAFKKMRSVGGSLVLKNVKPMVMEIFEITGMAGAFTFE